MQTVVKQNGKLSLKKMAKAANDYYEAHGYLSYNQNIEKRDQMA